MLPPIAFGLFACAKIRNNPALDWDLGQMLVANLSFRPYDAMIVCQILVFRPQHSTLKIPAATLEPDVVSPVLINPPAPTVET